MAPTGGEFWSGIPTQLAYGVGANFVTSCLANAARALAAQHRSRKARLAFIAQVEQASSTSGLLADGLETAFGHDRFVQMILEGQVNIAEIVMHTILPAGMPASDYGRVATAFINECRRGAEPMLKALVLSHESLTRTVTDAVAATVDRGVPSDPYIDTLLAELDDRTRLPDRDGELAFLNLLMSEPGRYEVIVGESHCGKSTLLAFFAAHPPAHVHVVGFFVVRRTGRNTVSRFLEVVIGQLLALLGRSCPGVSGVDRKRHQFEQLWNEASALVARSKRRLVLILDGLDEQDEPLSLLLPPRIPDHVSILISTRPNPEKFELFGRDHALSEWLTNPWRLEPTALTKQRHDRARGEIASVLGLTSGGPALDPVLYDVLATIAASGGEIDARSIGEITGHPESLVKSCLSRSNLVKRVQDAGPLASYELGHDTYDVALKEAVDLDRYRQLVRGWVRSYTNAGFPGSTPQFILQRYPQVIGLEELDALVGPAYRSRVRTTLGTDFGLVANIRDATAAHLRAEGSLDLPAVARLTMARLHISHRRPHLPDGLIDAHLACENVTAAYRLAWELPIGDAAVRALAAVASATPDKQLSARRWRELEARVDAFSPIGRVNALISMAENHPNDRHRLLAEAEVAAANLASSVRGGALVGIARASPGRELLERLEAAAADLDLRDRAKLLVAIAATNPSDRHRLLAEANAAAANLDLPERGDVLLAIAGANPGPELLNDLEAAAGDLDPRARKSLLLAIAGANVGRELLERLEAAADDLNPWNRAKLLLAIAAAYPSARHRLLAKAEAAVGDLDRGHGELLAAIAGANPGPELLERLEAAASDLHPRDRVDVFIAIASATPGERERLLAAAEAAARGVSRLDRAHALAAIAGANPGPQLLERLEAAADDLDPRDRVGAFVAIAGASPGPQLLERLETAGGDLDPPDRAKLLLAIAGANPGAELLERLEAAAGDLDPRGRADLLLAIAGVNASDQVRLLAAAEAASADLNPWVRAGAFVAIANASPGPEVLDRLEAAAGNLKPWDRASVLVAVAGADPGDHERLLVAAEAAEAVLDPRDRATLLRALASANPGVEFLERLEAAAANLGQRGRGEVLVAIADANPGPELLERLRVAADDLNWRDRAMVFVAIANAVPGERERLLAAAEAAAADLQPSDRVDVLAAIANAVPGDRERLLAAAEAAAADVRWRDRADALVAIARASPGPELLERLEAAADDLERADVLVAIAGVTHGGGRERLLAAAEAVVADYKPHFRREVLAMIAGANPGPELLDRLEAAADELGPGDGAKLLLAVAEAKPSDHERLLARAMSVLETVEIEVLIGVAARHPDLWTDIVDLANGAEPAAHGVQTAADDNSR